MSSESKKAKALELAITQIDRQFGKGSIMKLGQDHIPTNENSVSTGCLSLDVALGVGGVPRGRIIEIYGPESSGKTTLALHIVAEAQKSGGFAAYIDAEHAVDPEYSKKVHPNNKRRLVRALEIYKITGKNMTENFKSENKKSTFHSHIQTVYLRMSRKSLESIIHQRTLSMIENGMIEEVQYIKDNNYNIDHIDYIGFTEISSYLEKKMSKEDVIEKIHIRTRQYAKRQMKWFDNQSFDYVFDVDNMSVNDIVDKLVEIS